MPQTQPSTAFFGDRNAEIVVGQRPNGTLWAGRADGLHTIGMTVRTSRFQSWVMWIGTTGWKLSVSWTAWCGPTPRLVLFWNGMLVASPIGFSSVFAISVALWPATPP